jgi:hypothetical protein
MELAALNNLAITLRGPSLRSRVGLWLMPPQSVGSERDVAARVRADSADLREIFLESLPPETSFAAITPKRILRLLDALSSQASGAGCVVVYNLDLLLAGLTMQGRRDFWSQVTDVLMQRRRAILLTIPLEATHLAPDEKQQEAWRDDGRLVDR